MKKLVVVEEKKLAKIELWMRVNGFWKNGVESSSPIKNGDLLEAYREVNRMKDDGAKKTNITVYCAKRYTDGSHTTHSSVIYGKGF